MSDSETIEVIKKLPPNERREVEEFLREDQDPGAVRFVSHEDLEKSSREIFDCHETLLRKLAP